MRITRVLKAKDLKCKVCGCRDFNLGLLNHNEEPSLGAMYPHDIRIATVEAEKLCIQCKSCKGTNIITMGE